MIPDIVAKEAFSNRIVDWINKQGGWPKIEDYTRQKLVTFNFERPA